MGTNSKQAGSITDVPGVEVGSAQDEAVLTGCTAVLVRKGATAGVDVRAAHRARARRMC